MFKLTFAFIVIVKLLILASIAYTAYHLVADPAAFGAAIGRFFGGISYGYNSIS